MQRRAALDLQLVNREMRVSAVDNGPMAKNLMCSELVDFQKVDGYQVPPVPTWSTKWSATRRREAGTHR